MIYVYTVKWWENGKEQSKRIHDYDFTMASFLAEGKAKMFGYAEIYRGYGCEVFVDAYGRKEEE